MSEEYKLSYFKSFKMFNRAAYALMIVFALLVRGSEITKSNFFMFYYSILFIVMIGLDEYIFKPKRNKFPYLFLGIRVYLYPILLAIGTIFCVLPGVYLVGVISVMLYITCQDLIFTDVFNTFGNYTKRGVIGLVCGSMMLYVQYREEILGVWILVSVFALAVFISMLMFVYYFHYMTVAHLDDRYTKLYFKNADMITENKKLLRFQE